MRDSLTLTAVIVKRDQPESYAVAPLPAGKRPAGCVAGFTLRKRDQTCYVVCLLETGETGCTCLGFQSAGRCKHVAALSAAGLIDPAPWLTLRGARLILQAEQEQHQANAAGLENRRTEFATEIETQEAALDARGEALARRAYDLDQVARQLDAREAELATREAAAPKPARKPRTKKAA